MAIVRKGAEEELCGHRPVDHDLERQLEVRPDKQTVEKGSVIGDHDEPGCVSRYTLQTLDPDTVDEAEIEPENKAQPLLKDCLEKTVHTHNYITRCTAAFHCLKKGGGGAERQGFEPLPFSA